MVTLQPLAPEEVLEDWQLLGLPFDGQPILVASLTRGTTNQNYLIAIGGERLVLRINDPHSNALGIDREREAVILNAVSDSGLAPKVIFCDPGRGLLVTEYIAGRHWRPEDLTERRRVEQLCGLLQTVHNLKIDLPSFDYVAHIDQYWHQMLMIGRVTDEAAIEYQSMRSAAATLQSAGNGPRLCHHDPLPANIMESAGRLFLLDWEYAGFGNPLFDFAALAVDWGISEDLFRFDEQQRTNYCLAEQVYRYVCRLWCLIKKPAAF
jgi:thiamine kinase